MLEQDEGQILNNFLTASRRECAILTGLWPRRPVGGGKPGGSTRSSRVLPPAEKAEEGRRGAGSASEDD